MFDGFIRLHRGSSAKKPEVSLEQKIQLTACKQGSKDEGFENSVTEIPLRADFGEQQSTAKSTRFDERTGLWTVEMNSTIEWKNVTFLVPQVPPSVCLPNLKISYFIRLRLNSKTYVLPIVIVPMKLREAGRLPTTTQTSPMGSPIFLTRAEAQIGPEEPPPAYTETRI